MFMGPHVGYFIYTTKYNSTKQLGSAAVIAIIATYARKAAATHVIVKAVTPFRRATDVVAAFNVRGIGKGATVAILCTATSADPQATLVRSSF